MENNNIFESDFYPTPREVINRMMMNEDVTGKVILEPSAGSGNIVDWLQEYGAKEVLACETNKALRCILSRKCQLIGEDFLELQAEDVSHIDMIVMNPPFSADEQHILHAWKIAPAGCQIIALCNSNTLQRRYNRSRELLHEIIENNGYSEEYYDCFSTAERKTNVCISCVKLYKPGKNEEEFSGFFMTEEEEDAYYNGNPGLVRYNFIRDVVGRYVDAVSKFDGVMAAANEINELISFTGRHGIKFGAYQEKNSCTTITRDYFKKRLQKDAWRFIFDKLDMQKYVTSGVMSSINDFVEKQENVPFTMKNIYHMVDMIIQTHGERMNRVLVEAFDLICSFSADNSTAGETWKTNSNYMVNRRFIVPYICDYDNRWPTNYVKISYSGNRNKIDDIIKALCNLCGMEYDGRSMQIQDFCSRIKPSWGEWADFGFFRIRGYKKGTMHFEFQDEKLWMNFNRKVAEYKGWQLPDNVRKGKKK